MTDFSENMSTLGKPSKFSIFVNSKKLLAKFVNLNKLGKKEDDIMRRALIFFIVFTLGLTLTQDSQAKTPEEEFEAALRPCVDVTQPPLAIPLANCGSDPLTKGKAKIDKHGNVRVVVVGGEPDETYNVIYRSIDGGTELAIGTLTVDSNGDGDFEQKGFFSVSDIGSGNIVLLRDDGGLKDQFVTAFEVIGSDDDEPKFKSGMVLCREVNQPVGLANCGSDRLGEGEAEIDAEDGDVEVEVKKAEPNTSYDVVYRSIDGVTDLPVGTLITDAGGDGRLEVKDFFANGEIGSGNIVLQRDDGGLKDQFVTGFGVRRGAKNSPKAVVKSSLVRCIEVNLPELSNCGTDSLHKGFVMVDEKGRVKVLLVGAEPNTDYQVFFRPIDGSPEADTGIIVTTNSSGNSNTKRNIYAISTVGSGNIVVKREGFDQFVTGFAVTK
jgi:hypothetical protein